MKNTRKAIVFVVTCFLLGLVISLLVAGFSVLAGINPHTAGYILAATFGATYVTVGIIQDRRAKKAQLLDARRSLIDAMVGKR